MKKQIMQVFTVYSVITLTGCNTYFMHHDSWGLFERNAYDEVQTVSGPDYTQYPSSHYLFRYSPYDPKTIPSAAPKPNMCRGENCVKVPNTYHIGPMHSPISSQDRDRGWVKSQNPQGYTIEMGDDEKASEVAHKLHSAPKSERMAEIKYQRNGKPTYKGVYGSYESREAAQKAFDNLPEHLRTGSSVKDWGSVQGGIGE
jgi:SPOR domain